LAVRFLGRKILKFFNEKKFGYKAFSCQKPSCPLSQSIFLPKNFLPPVSEHLLLIKLSSKLLTNT
jgi:hypothetical protein